MLYQSANEILNIGFGFVEVITTDPFSTLQYHDVGVFVDASVHSTSRVATPVLGVQEKAASGVFVVTLTHELNVDTLYPNSLITVKVIL
jgi:hypothetical protein